MAEQFTFYNDPGHGWLAITPARSWAAGVDPATYSPFSYYLPRCEFAPAGLLLLEEDCDAGRFFRAAGYDPQTNRPNVKDVFGDPVKFPFPVRRRFVNLRDLPRLSGVRFRCPGSACPVCADR